ncbi:hypothetical protein [Clostridioides sp. ZZV15-6598]|uniref:hypothetical protein n=1 Tax=Clostridioides sp. ZZV15-6598 TaxID=2811501 RepID=UPI001D0FD92F|nr:hypothetical protein [Clostridioides sp. ZZV15-6598]
MIPVMSFWPNIYYKIISQTKLVEYRRCFPKKCTYAYMYISKPVKAICGIIYFSNKHSLSDWKEEYSSNPEILSRIHDYSKQYRYGMEIEGIQLIIPITLDMLRTNVNNFVAPQSYLLLENNVELSEYIKNNTFFIGERINNNLNNIFPDHICRRY